MSATPPRPDGSAWLPQGGPPPAPRTAAPAVRADPPPRVGPARRAGAPLLRRDVLVPAWLLALGVAALAAAMVACVVLAGRDTAAPAPLAAASTATATATATTTAPAATPAAPAATATAPATAPPAARSLPEPREIVRPLRDPFEVDGVRWAVFVNPVQRWTVFAKKTPAGAGRRWVLLSVRLHNLTRAAFAPTALPLRLTDSGGRVYPPEAAHSNAPASTPRVPPATRGQVELAYRVPTKVTALRLRFPVGDTTRVTVPIVAP